MSEFQPVETKADLEQLDVDEVVAGYRAGCRDASEPGSDKSRAYWHGWRNAQIDRGRMPVDAAASRLVRDMLGSGVNAH